jgi:hypothetical protein
MSPVEGGISTIAARERHEPGIRRRHYKTLYITDRRSFAKIRLNARDDLKKFKARFDPTAPGPVRE